MKSTLLPAAISVLLLTMPTFSKVAGAAKLPVDPLHLAIGFGVEMDASPEIDILALFEHYLTEASDSLRATLWSAPERKSGPYYDLLAPYVYQGFTHFTVVELGPAVGMSQTYLIRTLVSAVDDSTLDVRPLALYRVYATREEGHWVLANALPRMTSNWQHLTIAPLTYVYPASHEFNRSRARATAAFVDSLAGAFELAEPDPITYYFTDDLAETLRALGLEYFPLGGDPVGGRSNVVQRQVYIGCSFNGEGYRHELCHVLLAPELSKRTHRLAAEGLMTWTGGSGGRDFEELVPDLARYLTAHPELSLQGLLEDPPPRRQGLDVGYVGLGVLCRLVFERAGLSGLRTLLAAGRDPEAIVSTTARVLGISPVELGDMWLKECGGR